MDDLLKADVAPVVVVISDAGRLVDLVADAIGGGYGTLGD
jgi:hypothetical protein